MDIISKMQKELGLSQYRYYDKGPETIGIAGVKPSGESEEERRRKEEEERRRREQAANNQIAPIDPIQSKKQELKSQEFQDPNPTSFTNFTEPKREDKPKGSGLYRDMPNRTQEVRKSIDEYTKLAREKLKDPYLQYGSNLTEDLKRNIDEKRAMGMSESDIRESLIPGNQEIPGRLREIEASLKDGREGYMYNIMEGWREKEVQGMISAETVKEINGLPNDLKVIEKWLEEHPEIGQSGEDKGPVSWLKSGTRFALGSLNRQLYDSARHAIKQPETYGWIAALGIASAMAAPFTGGLSLAVPVTMMGGAAVGTVTSAVGSLGPIGAIKMGMRYGSYDYMAKVEAANSYNEQLERGIDKRIALPIAQFVGAFNGVVEQLQLDAAMRMIPGVQTLLDEGSTMAKKELINQSIKVLANYGVTVGSEVLEEVLQAGITEYGNVVGEYIQNTPDVTMKGGLEALRKRTTDKEFWDILEVEGYEALKSMWLSPILSSSGRATFQAGQNKLALNRVNNYIAMEDAQSRQVAKNQKDFLIEDGKMTDIAIEQSERGNERATEFIFAERQILEDIKERTDTTNADRAKIDKNIEKIDESIGKQMYKTKTVDPTLEYKPTNSVDIENNILDYGFIGSEDVVNPDLTHATVETYKQTIDLGINETIKMELAKGTSKLEIQNIVTKALPKKLRNAYQVRDFISIVETIQNEIKGQKVANALYNYNVLHNHNEQQKLNNLNVDAETTETETTVKNDPVEADLKVESDDVNTNTQQTSEEVATDQEMPLNEVVDEQPIEMGGEIESIDNKVEIDTKEEEYKPSKVVVVPLEKMNLDPERFQFRYDIADDRSLDGVEFDENLAGVVSLWEDEHGDLYVIDGHLRVGKFKEMGINEMNAKIFSYKDMDSNEARAFGAMLNIADGKATAIDVGKVLRDSHITQEKLETYISPKSKIARDGVALSNLNDFLFTQVATKAIPLERAVIIGRELKGNHDGQNQFMKTIRDKESSGANITNAVMTEMLAEVKGTAQEKYIEINMLGEQEMTRNFSVERAEIVSYVKSQLKSKVSLLKNVSKDKNAAMLNELGNKIATEDNVAEMNQADQALFILDKSLNWKGTTTNELFNKLAKEYAQADLKDRAAIKRKALRELVKLMEGGKLLNETINQRTTRQDVKDTISGVIGEGETGATGIGVDQQIENQVDFFGQEIVNQLKQEEQIKVINIDEVEGTKVHTETKDIVNAMKNNVFFNGLEVEYSGKSSTRYWTRKELDNAGYRNAKPGRYTTNGFYNPGHQDTLQSKPTRRIVLNDEGDRSTIIEEAIHDIQTRAEEISPKFAVMVKAWEDEINAKAKELEIDIPQGKELFAQTYVFTEMGHAEKSNISDLIAMPEDLVEYIEAILGEEILDLARGKIDPKIDKADRKLKSDYKSYALRLFKDKTAMPTIREAQKVRMAEMKVELQNNRAVSYRSPVNSQYVIVSPSVKGSKYQITTFSDRFGPVTDSQHDDLDSVAARLIKDGFTYKVDEVSYQLRQHTRDTVDSIYERAMMQQNFLTDNKNTNIEISTSEIIDLLGDARIGNIAPADFDNLILHNKNIDVRTKHDLLDRMLDAVDNGYDAPNSEITFPQYLKRFYGVPIGESQRVSFSSGKHFNTLYSDKTRLRVTNDNKVDVSKIEPTLDKPDIKPVGRFDTVEEAITYYKDNFLVISLMLHSNDIMEKYFTYTNKTMEGLETEYQDFKDNMETFRNKGIETDFTGKPHYAISYQLKEAADIESDNFKNWFKDSKVVDKDGKPLVVYHGTPLSSHSSIPGSVPFAEFKPNFSKQNQVGYGIHFTPDMRFAEEYTNIDGHLYEAYLQINNPLDLDQIVDEGTPLYKLALKANPRAYTTTDMDTGKRVVSLRNALESIGPEKAQNLIIQAGYDGVKYIAEMREYDLYGYKKGESALSYVAFNPTQIKSVYNNGMFNEYDPNINYQLQETDSDLEHYSLKVEDTTYNNFIKDNETTAIQFSEGKYLESPVLKTNEVVNDADMYDVLVRDAVNGAYDYIQMKDNDVIPVTKEMIEDVMTQGQPLFQLREVENKDGLLAVHNMSESNLVNSLKLGGLPYPSIAITKQDIPHESFGEISLIFKKDTIDPKSMKANKVYSRDAYTQTFPEVGVIYDEKKLEKVAKDLNKLAEGTRFRHQAYRITDRIEDRIDTVGLEGAIKEAAETVFAKAMYLLENNIEHETFYKQDNYSRYISNKYLQMFLDMYPGDKTKLNELRFDDTKALRPIMEVVWEEYFRDDGIPEEYISNMVTQKVEKYHDVDDLIYGAYKLANYGERQVVDENKSDNLIQSLVSNEQAEAWLTDKIGDIVIRMGIRNDKDRFTPSGNRRSKAALYGPYDLANVLKVMKKESETGVDVMFPGINAIAGAAAKTYKSIAEIKADSYKIQDVEYEDMAELSDSKGEELSDITNQMVIGYGESNPFIASDRAKSAIIEIAREPNRTKTYITNELKSWGMNVNDSIVKDIQDFLVSLEELPTRYFEAKPRRGVMFNEVAIAHVPNTIQDTTRTMLERSGVQLIVEYDPGIEGDRKAQLDNVLGTDEILFQLRETEDTEFKEWFKDSKVVDENGKPLVVYHGSFTDFDTFALGDVGYHFGTLDAAQDRLDWVKDYKMYPDEKQEHMYPVYLNIQRPLVVDDIGTWEPLKLIESLKTDLSYIGEKGKESYGKFAPFDMAELKELEDTYFNLEANNYSVDAKSKWYATLKSKLFYEWGIDGIQYKNSHEDRGSTSYIAFYPTQIKSVDNRGTWSATDANIYYQLSESLDAEFKPSKWKLTVQNSNLVDPALKALLMSEDLLYEVKRNKYQMLEAAEFIEEKGEAWIYNWITGDLPGTDLMFAAAQLLISKYQQIGEFETAVTLTNAISPKATKLGQAIQILSQVGKETPQGMTRYFSKQLSDTLTGRDLEKINDKSTDISDTLNDINIDGIDDVDIDGAIDKTKEITPEEMLARRISNTLTSKNKAEKDNLQMMIDTLFEVAKESPLPDNKAIPTNPMVFIIDAIVNRHEYREVWEETKKILADKFEDNPEQMDMLDDYFNKDIIQTFADSQLKKVMDKELKEMNYKIKDVIKEHYSVGDKLNRTLADKLVSEAGLNPTEAAILASYIQRDLANRTKAAKEAALERIFKKNKVTKKEKQTIDAKIIELSNLGAFTNDKFKPLTANLLGLTVMNDELFEYIYKQAEYIQTLEPGREKDKAVALLVKEVSKNVPVSKWEKMATIYAMGHLLNVRTTLRNLLGNSAFGMLDTVTMNYYGAGIDKAMHLLTGRERVTQHRALIDILKTQYSAYFKELKLGIEDAMLGINTFDEGSKYDLRPTRAFGNSQSTNPVVQLADNIYGKLETIMDITMRATDRAAWSAGFADSIQEQLLISGLDVPTEDMIIRATQFGLVRTFNDETALSQAFSGIKKNLNKGTSYITKQEDFGLGNLALNYPSTPANILSRFIEYSPIGLMQGITDFIGDKTGDEYSRSRNFVESTARGLHGSTIIAIGFVLASLGIITGGGPEGEDPKKLYELKKEAGFQDYAINITAIGRQIIGRFKNPEDGKLQPGDKLSSYDWMDPISLLIATGANVVHTRGSMLGFLGSIAAAYTTGISELTNEPVFTGLSKLFAYGDPAKGATNLVLDLPASLSPQFWSHVANAIDGSNKDAWTGYTKGRQIYNAIIRKIPFAKGQLPDRYDKMGEKMEYYPEDTGVFQRIFRSVINPSIYGEYNPTPTAQLLLELFEETGDARIVPKGMQKSYTIEGEKYTLSPEVNSELSEWIGKEFQTRVTYAMKHYMSHWNTPDQVEEIRFIIKELEDELKEKIYDKGTKLE